MTVGKPFQKGQSGDPGGRPKVVAEVKELARAHTAEAIQTLVSIMNDPKSAQQRGSRPRTLFSTEVTASRRSISISPVRMARGSWPFCLSHAKR